ncbi:MAG TPA: hypothetical protein VLV84_02645, partial [Candidatus Acidoferrales bacterium]|nr:hypothetical protein [Candidatus Acidoferrales bacterium]
YNPPANNATRIYDQIDPTTNVFIMYDKEAFQYSAWSLTNGNLVWGPISTSDETALQYFQWSAVNDGVVSNGNLYATGWGGVVYCINDTNGQVEWTYGNGGAGNSTSMGVIGPWGNYPTFIGAIAGGSVYVYNSEHSPIEPPYTNEEIRCLNAATGQETWTLTAWPVSTSFYTYIGALADGYLTFFNEYDGRMYSVGKGPSATTVSTQATVAPLGSSVLIQGTVTDQSAGAKGTPAISDQDMSEWMAYLYNQHAEPTNATGVPVQITAIGPDGTSYPVGTATSDIYGNFGITWTPPAQGTYQIIANFAGTNAYGNSAASTYVAVGPASSAPSTQVSPTVPPTSSPTPTTSTPPSTQTASPSPSAVVAPPGNTVPIATYVAIGAAVVIIVAVAAALILRKRNK